MASFIMQMRKELVILILDLLDEANFKETIRSLERESGCYFNMKHFEELFLAGEFDAVEKYLSGFIKLEECQRSVDIFFEIRKQKYLEALDKNDRGKAVKILKDDLMVFSPHYKTLIDEMKHFITLDNFREFEKFSYFGDAKTARRTLLFKLKAIIEAHPSIRDKMIFPSFKAGRLRTLIDKSLRWQHYCCKYPRQKPDFKSMLTDHVCATSSGAHGPPRFGVQPIMPFSVKCDLPIPSAHGAFRVWGAPSRTLPQVSLMKDEKTAAVYLADSKMKQICSSQDTKAYSHEDLPKTVVRALIQGSQVTSLDFHPHQHTLLLVGTNVGEISIWEVGSGVRKAHRAFKVWDDSSCSYVLQSTSMDDFSISVNRCLWSPDGLMIGVAFSKHLVHTYMVWLTGDLRPHLEIDAHIGSVNDLAFAHPEESLLIISCGDDTTIKVWNATHGQMEIIFEGHEAPVYSICPNLKESILFLVSTSLDGKIKLWKYGCSASLFDFEAPGHECTVMAYSADGTRLFSRGTNKDGDSHLVEWNEADITIRRSYWGLSRKATSMIQFDTMRNCVLAAGDDFKIKFWDMDDENMLTETEADGGLSAFPHLKFNKDGSLLAVSTVDIRFKIFANPQGQKLIRSFERRV
ncbi:protein TOPLESS-RELATED PROTEIN 2-like isoform X2 [Wolffia australiana]